MSAKKTAKDAEAEALQAQVIMSLGRAVHILSHLDGEGHAAAARLAKQSLDLVEAEFRALQHRRRATKTERLET